MNHKPEITVMITILIVVGHLTQLVPIFTVIQKKICFMNCYCEKKVRLRDKTVVAYMKNILRYLKIKYSNLHNLKQEC